MPAELSDRTRRAERIRQGAQELRAQLQRRARADEDRHAAAAARRQRSEQGEPVVGRIPNGPHRLPEARAHLAREIAAHQAKLDRYARLIAEGRKPMGRPPVAMEDSTRVQRARRVVRHAETAERVTVQADGQSASDAKRLPKVVVNIDRSAVTDHANPQGIPTGLQRPGRGDRRSTHHRSPRGPVDQRSSMLPTDDAGSARRCGPDTRCYRQCRSRDRHGIG